MTMRGCAWAALGLLGLAACDTGFLHGDLNILPATGCGPDAVPEALTLELDGADIILSWENPATNAEGFTIERDAAGGGRVVVATIDDAETLTYRDTSTKVADSAYIYRVAAVRSSNDGEECATPFSSEVQIVTAPSTPTLTSVSATGESSIQLHWTNTNTQHTGFRLERRGGVSTDFELIDDAIGTNETSYDDTGLSFDTFYEYRLSALGVSANSPAAEGQAWTASRPVADLTPEAQSTSGITVSWTNPNSNQLNFTVERRTTAGSFEAPTSVAASPFVDTLLTPETEYEYRVTVVGQAGSTAGVTASTWTLSPAPSGLSADPVSDTQIDLTWSDNSGAETGFVIERSDAGADTFVEIGTVASSVTSFSDTTVLADQAYDYRVRAQNPGGDSDFSAATVRTRPAAPADFAATTVSETAIDLSWTDPMGTETHFELYRRVVGAGSFVLIDDGIGPDTTTYSDATGVVDTAYEYRLWAVNASGASPDALVTGWTLPAAVTGLAAAATGDSTIQLTWTNPNTTDIQGYTIARRLSGVGSFVVIDAGVSAGATSYDDSGLTPGAAYDYEVNILNPGGSNTASVTSYTQYAAVTDLVGAPMDVSIDLTWTDTNAAPNNETGMRVEYKESSASVWTTAGTTSADAVAFQITGLTEGTAYDVRVVVEGVAEDSAPSAVAVTTITAPSLSWTTAPSLSEGSGACVLSAPGSVSYGSGSVFSSADGDVATAATTSADETGLTADIEVMPGLTLTSWSITEDHGVTASIERMLEVSMPDTETTLGLPDATSFATTLARGRQLYRLDNEGTPVSNCETCGGSRGQISAGGRITCLLGRSGDVWCWGYNQINSLALAMGPSGPYANRSVQLCESGTSVDNGYCDGAPITGVVEVGAGNDSGGCVLIDTGRVRCWGGASLGSETAIEICTSGTVAGSDCVALENVTTMAVGQQHACAITYDSGSTNRAVYCWGAGGSGQLGTSANSTLAIQLDIPVTDAVQVAAGRGHSCAVTDGGFVRCWGANNVGQRGWYETGLPTSNSPIPNFVCDDGGDTCNGGAGTRLSNIVSVAAGNGYTCALNSSGDVLCWGANDVGQITGVAGGGGAKVTVPTVVVSGAKAVDVFGTYSCAITGVNNEVQCWGTPAFNSWGVIGRSTADPALGYACDDALDGDPATCNHFTGAMGITVGTFNTCVLTETASVCFGDNNLRTGNSGPAATQYEPPCMVDDATRCGSDPTALLQETALRGCGAASVSIK